MNKLKSEYKILIFLGVLFLIILTIVLIRYNVIGNKLNEIKSKEYIKCNNVEKNNGITYIEHYCSITDDLNASFAISYPELKMDTKDVKKVNKELSSSYDKLLNKLKFETSDGIFYLPTFSSLEYEIYSSKGIVSVLIRNQGMEEKDDSYKKILNLKVYNIDIETGNLLKEFEMKKRCDITHSLISLVQMEVIKMYALNHGYDYIGILSYLRDNVLDESIESVTYNNLSNLYIDDEGNTNFIYLLYNPKYNRKIPYYFKIDENNKITYEIREE